MKRECDEKREVYEYMITQPEGMGNSNSGKGEHITSRPLQAAHNEYEERSTLDFFVPRDEASTKAKQTQFNTYAVSLGLTTLIVTDINPCMIHGLKEIPPKSNLEPTIYSDQTSKITPDALELDGCTADEALAIGRLSAVDNYGFSQRLTVFPLSEPPTANNRDLTTCENHLQLHPKLTPTCKMKLSRFWVRELRITDRILDWEKLKRTMFEELLPNTLLNNNSNATVRKSLLDSSWETNLSEEKFLLATRIQFEQCRNMIPTPPPKPPYQYLQRTKAIFQTDMEHLTKGYSIIQVETFNSKKKRSGVLLRRNVDSKTTVHWKGEAEMVLRMCSRYYIGCGILKDLDNGSMLKFEDIVKHSRERLKNEQEKEHKKKKEAQEISNLHDALQVEEANAIKEREAAQKAIQEAPLVIKETPVIIEDTKKINSLMAEVNSLKKPLDRSGVLAQLKLHNLNTYVEKNELRPMFNLPHRPPAKPPHHSCHIELKELHVDWVQFRYASNANSTGLCRTSLKVADFSYNFLVGSIPKCLEYLPRTSFQGNCLRVRVVKQQTKVQCAGVSPDHSHLVVKPKTASEVALSKTGGCCSSQSCEISNLNGNHEAVVSKTASADVTIFAVVADYCNETEKASVEQNRSVPVLVESVEEKNMSSFSSDISENINRSQEIPSETRENFNTITNTVEKQSGYEEPVEDYKYLWHNNCYSINDVVLNEEVTNDEVYHETVVPLVPNNRPTTVKESKSEAKFQEQNIDRVESTDIDQTMFNESNKSEAQLCQETRCLLETPLRPPPQNFSTTVQPSPTKSKSPDQSSKLLALLITLSQPSLVHALPPALSPPMKPPDRSVAAANSEVNFNSAVDADSNFVVLLKLVCSELTSKIDVGVMSQRQGAFGSIVTPSMLKLNTYMKVFKGFLVLAVIGRNREKDISSMEDIAHGYYRSYNLR
ncbi:hydrolase of sodium-potassium ATPase alpha subunit, putative [Medicago truncatula]|uniref:Hydrolase of sodium-potassium ATPase alpha subunit, putative n=1 Tax=Medicago truncatula TaxID=3880 RepID=A0A072UEV1_MEDTR|nr:hydrolase of sodium-potassium ATPase alpha subunit, putative [Medicago truncatula]